MKVENLLEIVEKDKSIYNIDRRTAIIHLNDALRTIVESENLEHEKIIDDLDENKIKLNAEIIRLNYIGIGIDDVYTEIEGASDVRFINKSE